MNSIDDYGLNVYLLQFNIDDKTRIKIDCQNLYIRKFNDDLLQLNLFNIIAIEVIDEYILKIKTTEFSREKLYSMCLTDLYDVHYILFDDKETLSTVYLYIL